MEGRNIPRIHMPSMMLLASLLLALAIHVSHPIHGVDAARIEDVEYPSKVYDGEAARITFKVGNPSIKASGDAPPRFFLRVYLDGGLVRDELPESWECPEGRYVERVVETPPLRGPGDHAVRGELYWLNQSIAVLQDVKTLEIKAVKLRIVDFSQSISQVTLGGSQPLRFQVQFANGGNDVMYDAYLKAVGPPGVKVTPDKAYVGDIPIGESAGATLELSIEPPVTQGYVEISYEVSYKDFKGGLHAEEFKMGLSISKAPSSIQLILEGGGEVAYGSEVALKARLTGLGEAPLPGEPVEFYIDNRSVGVGITDDKGETSIKVGFILDAGIHEVKASYGGSSVYAPSSTAKSLRVSQAAAQLSLSISSPTVRVGDEAVAYVKLTDEGGSPIRGAEILLYCGEELIGRGFTDDAGEAEIPIRLDSSGYKPLRAVYNGDVNHKGVERVGHIEAKPLQTLLRIQAPSQVWKGEKITYRIALTDELGRPVGDAPVNVEVSARNMPIARLSLKTDIHGTVEGVFNATMGGQLKISASYMGDQRHAPAGSSHTLTVMESSIIALVAVPVVGALGGITAALLSRRGAFSNLRGGLSRGIRGRPVGEKPIEIGKAAAKNCASCGRLIPSGAAFCDWCGSPQAAPYTAEEPAPPSPQPQEPQVVPEGVSGGELDQRVLSYIAEHGGEISLSRASADLGLSREELLAVIDRLRRSGRLEPA
ncbi:MAG: Ig-like domain repeat protein [Candidatus Bathyarchaeia archaeon]